MESLIRHAIEVFIFLFVDCVLFLKKCLFIYICLFLSCSYFYCWVLWVVCIFSYKSFSTYMFCKDFFPNLWLVILFSEHHL
jgi:hypothetical protein